MDNQTVVLPVLGVVLLSILIILLFALVVGYHLFYRHRAEQIVDELDRTVLDLTGQVKQISESTPVLNVAERVQFTNDFYKFIDEQISTEIINERKTEILLIQANPAEKPKNLDFDNVITKVSNTVFDSIRKDVYIDPNHIVTESAIMSHIQKRTVLLYLTYLNENVASLL